jgi:hypothetical protein
MGRSRASGRCESVGRRLRHLLAGERERLLLRVRRLSSSGLQAWKKVPRAAALAQGEVEGLQEGSEGGRASRVLAEAKAARHPSLGETPAGPTATALMLGLPLLLFALSYVGIVSSSRVLSRNDAPLRTLKALGITRGQGRIPSTMPDGSSTRQS